MSRIQEMLDSGDSEMVALGTYLRNKEKAEVNLNLSYMKKVMRDNKDIVICGSLGLFLQGVWLERWLRVESDLDLICPEDFVARDLCRYIAFREESDFNFRFEVEDRSRVICMDVKIDPGVNYVKVSHTSLTGLEMEYKVLPIHEIMEAKCRYAMRGHQKHIDDIKEICTAMKIEPERKNEKSSSYFGMYS